MRTSDLRFLIAWLLPVLTLFSVSLRPGQAALGTLVMWLLIALTDVVLPGGKKSPAALGPEANLSYFRWVLRVYVALQLVLIAVGAYAAAQADWLTVLGIAFSVGFITGSQGITFAHELGHSKFKSDRFCGWILMTSVCYGHFMVEHYRGHHPRAATHDDPATSRRGESLYRFLPRTLWGSLVSGWRLEAQRLRQVKSSWLRSPLAWSALASLTLLALPAALPAALLPAQFAAKCAVFFACQAIVAFGLLEIVNYIEHYGLERHTRPAGEGLPATRREPFGVMHAWNADHVATNSMLANLQRHSDHHMHAWKPYATLEPLPGPQLPTGYAGCLLLAMLPPLWFSIMHRRLAALPTPGQAAPA